MDDEGGGSKLDVVVDGAAILLGVLAGIGALVTNGRVHTSLFAVTTVLLAFLAVRGWRIRRHDRT